MAKKSLTLVKYTKYITLSLELLNDEAAALNTKVESAKDFKREASSA